MLQCCGIKQYTQTEKLQQIGKCCAKGSGKEVEIQEFMYRDTSNVEPEMYDYTNNKCSQWKSNEKFKEKFGSCARKTLERFTTRDSYTWNITHNTESTAV
jgi:hypothetical protein